MTTATLKRRAAALGVEVSTTRSELANEVAMMAPTGMVFAANGGHTSVSCDSDGGPMGPLVDDAGTVLADGLRPCDDPDCDICQD